MKLNKSQITAIASKIKFDADKKDNEILKEASKKYLKIANEIIALEKVAKVAEDKIKDIKQKTGLGYYTTYNDTKPETIAHDIAKKQSKIETVCVNQIESALVIASVDSQDMETLLKNYEKFLI